MVLKYTIYGERCSGTNYLGALIQKNFNATVTWDYGWKHFFGFNNLSNSNDTLFVCIIRDPYEWINSFYRNQYHVAPSIRSNHIVPSNQINNLQAHIQLHNQNVHRFLNREFWSVHHDDDKKEQMCDRHIYTKKRYKNVFELRHTKLQFLIEHFLK